MASALAANRPVMVGSSATEASRSCRWSWDAFNRASESRLMNAASISLCCACNSLRSSLEMCAIGWIGSVMFHTDSIMCISLGIRHGVVSARWKRRLSRW